MTQQAMKLGYIGLGNMGAPMAGRWVWPVSRNIWKPKSLRRQ
ncbi:Probable dehydrogenase/reductase [Mycobacteroides abscessus subsp. abscessus]|nr:Probable dehydrogenase/reductase [Mycobacteroides abscessus subsp. abscessus]